MIHAYKLFTGEDGDSHVVEGNVSLSLPTDVTTISFAESPAHASFDWHNAPRVQFVITLSGTLEFTTRDGTAFTLRPGDVLVAADTTGSGHKWRLIDDQPWRRIYVGIDPGASDQFTPLQG
jgi:quercetin dioxygenase-like cupin family protein